MPVKMGSALALLWLLTTLQLGCQSTLKPVKVFTLDEEGAHRLLWSLPETQHAAAHIRSSSGGVARPISMVESRPTPENPRAPWVVFFGEDRPDHVTRWTTFEVDSITQAIRVWEWSQDTYVKLEDWRRGEGSRWLELTGPQTDDVEGK